jgi:hypothetical protein
MKMGETSIFILSFYCGSLGYRRLPQMKLGVRHPVFGF